jgi:hypothetical protein
MDALQLKGLLSNTGYELSSSLSLRQGRAWLALMIHAGNFLPLEKVHSIEVDEFCERVGLAARCEDDAEAAVKNVLESLMRISAYRSDETTYYHHTLITWFCIEGNALRYSLDGAFLHRVLPIVTRSN